MSDHDASASGSPSARFLLLGLATLLGSVYFGAEPGSESDGGGDASRNEVLAARVQVLERALRERDQRIFDLRADVARGSAASPDRVDALIGLADEAIREARFASALELSSDAAESLAVIVPMERVGRTARLEFVRATAFVALGNEQGAARSIERLLEVAPGFRLDEANDSPKLVRVLQRVRSDTAHS